MSCSPKYLDFKRVAIAHRDIQEAANGATFLIENNIKPAEAMYQVVFFGLTCSYAKPFTVNAGLGSASKKWYRFEDKSLQAYHEELLNYRNKLVAHSDSEMTQVGVLMDEIELTVEDEKHITHGPMLLVSSQLPPDGKIEKYLTLFEFQEARMSSFIYEFLEANKNNIEFKMEFRPKSIGET